MNFKILALLALFVFSVNSVKADVLITRLEPPFQVIVPWENLPDPLVEAIDFNNDGQVDLNFTYDNVYMSAHFFAPSQIVIVPTAPPAGRTNIYGGVAALPFGTIIGSNVVSSANLGNDLWWQGYSDEGGLYGDHANDVGYVVSDATIGDPPVVSGDVVGVSGRSKPARAGRMKTSHFEGRIALSAEERAQGRDESTQRELATFHNDFGGTWLVSPADCA